MAPIGPIVFYAALLTAYAKRPNASTDGRHHVELTGSDWSSFTSIPASHSSMDRFHLNGGNWRKVIDRISGSEKAFLAYMNCSFSQLEQMDKTGHNFMTAAAIYPNTEALTLILESRPDSLLVSDKHGWHALTLASFNGRDSFIRLALRHNPNIFVHADARGWTPMTIAAMTGDLTLISLAMDHQPSLLLQRNEQGQHAIGLLLNQANLKACAFLIQQVPHLLIESDGHHRNAVIQILEQRHPQVIRLLAKYNDYFLDTVNSNGYSTREYLKQLGKLDLIDLIR